MLLACQGQLRLAPSGHVIGIDMHAALKIGAPRGYRNQGRRPWETVERFVSQSPARQGG